MLKSALLLAAACLSAAPALAADPSPAKIGDDGQAIVDRLNGYLDEDIANTRKTCVSGQAPEWVSAKRARYGEAVHFADASDMCVATLTSIAGDRGLLDLYRQLLVDQGGSAAAYSQLPGAIGAAVMGGATKVSIGNYKAEAVTPALAFDAGFTVAYQQGTASKPLTADPAQLKTIAEACMGQGQDAGTCFSVGYVYGASAFRTGHTAP